MSLPQSFLQTLVNNSEKLNTYSQTYNDWLKEKMQNKDPLLADITLGTNFILCQTGVLLYNVCIAAPCKFSIYALENCRRRNEAQDLKKEE